MRSFISFAILLHIFWESFFATLIELWKSLDLTVFKGILAAVSHSVEELCILASRDSLSIVQVSELEDRFYWSFAWCQVNLWSNQWTNWFVIWLVNIIQVAARESLELEEVIGEAMRSQNNHGENKPTVDHGNGMVLQVNHNWSSCNVYNICIIFVYTFFLVFRVSCIRPLVEPAYKLINSFSNRICRILGCDGDNKSET